MFYQVPLRHHLMSPFMRIPINGIFQFFPFRSTDFRTDHNIDPVDIFNHGHIRELIPESNRTGIYIIISPISSIFPNIHRIISIQLIYVFFSLSYKITI